MIYGNFCEVYGDHCTVSGNFCTVHGKDCAVSGHFCEKTGAGTSRARETRGTTVAAGVGVMVSGQTTARAATTPGGGVRVTVGDGIHTMSGGGHVQFGGSRILINGVDIEDLQRALKQQSPGCASASSSSPKKRPRDGDDKSKDGRKARASSSEPFPLDHKTQKAEDGETACCACHENRVDAILHPCTHVTLCMTCAIRIYTDKPDKRECPICRAQIEKIGAANVCGVQL